MSGYARGSRVTGEAPRVRPDRTCRLMNRFLAVAPSSVWAVRRQRWRVTTQIRHLADGFDMAFARNHAGRARGIPVTIAIDSGDYDRPRGCEVAVSYALAGGLLQVSPPHQVEREDHQHRTCRILRNRDPMAVQGDEHNSHEGNLGFSMNGTDTDDGYTAKLASRATVAVLTLWGKSRILRFLLIAASAAVLIALAFAMSKSGSHVIVSMITGGIIGAVFQLLTELLGRRRTKHAGPKP